MPTVCIIEDDSTLRDELARLLELDGYETRVCTDFANASSTRIPTASSWTWGCPVPMASPYVATSAPEARCPSSSSRQ